MCVWNNQLPDVKNNGEKCRCEGINCFIVCLFICDGDAYCCLLSNCNLQTSCALHYHYLVTSRLLSSLPPSVQYLMLVSNPDTSLATPDLLHTLRWSTRLGQKSFRIWVTDSLVKQSLPGPSAERLVNSTADTIDNVAYLVQLMLGHLKTQVCTIFADFFTWFFDPFS